MTSVARTHWLSIDFETRSTVNLRSEGIYRYAEHPTTDVWCMSYCINNGPIERWAMGEEMPDEIGAFLTGWATGLPSYVRAWNAQFERLIWREIMAKRYRWSHIPLEMWVCTAALGARCGLPRKLEDAALALDLPVQKDMAGHKLMMQMAKPRKMKDGSLKWWDDAERRKRLGEYCDVDVEVEMAVFDRLPPTGGWKERELWLFDQTINDRGILLDVALAERALDLTARATRQISSKLHKITDGSVTAVTQIEKLKTWVGEQGLLVGSLAKIPMERMLKDEGIATYIKDALELRKEGGKSSTSKFRAMLNWRCGDDVLRGMLLYHAAGTGRWAGRGPQPQNFIKGEIKVTPDLVADVMEGNFNVMRVLYGSPMTALTSVLRGCFMARPGREFTSADFNAIEARLVAWLFDAKKLVKLFASGGKVYEDMAATIYRMAIDDVAKDSMERFVAKNTVLGCGFQMGATTFRTQLREKFGVDVSEELAERAVQAYRGSNPEIPEGWHDMNDTSVQVVRDGRTDWVPVQATSDRIHFRLWQDWLQMRLPSGRSLWYAEPEVVTRQVRSKKTGKWFDTTSVRVMGVHPKIRKWVSMHLYGGLLTENAVQAIARDLLADGMLRVEAAGYPVVLTVHDEVVTEHEVGFGSVEDYIRILTEVPTWAVGCPIAAEGWRGTRYRK